MKKIISLVVFFSNIFAVTYYSHRVSGLEDVVEFVSQYETVGNDMTKEELLDYYADNEMYIMNSLNEQNVKLDTLNDVKQHLNTRFNVFIVNK